MAIQIMRECVCACEALSGNSISFLGQKPLRRCGEKVRNMEQNVLALCDANFRIERFSSLRGSVMWYILALVYTV